MNKVYFIALLIGLGLPEISFSANPIQYATASFRLTLSSNGQVQRFVDLRDGVNYADASDTRFCVLRLQKSEAGVACDSVVQKKDTLIFSFPGTALTVKLLVAPGASYLTVDVLEITGGDFYSLQFARIPLTINYQKDDFAACAMSRKLNTKTLDFPGKSNLLGGQCFKELGYEGAGVFLLGMPEFQLRQAMKQVVDQFVPGEMPVSRAGGPYAMDHPKNYGSYIISAEPITEQQVDEWVAHLSRFGINQVDFHQGQPFRQGDFHFNEKAYPNGVADFHKMSEAFGRHGILTGLHTYSALVDHRSIYVTPVPSKDLDILRSFTLAGDLSTDEQRVPVDESTREVSDVTGFLVRNSKIIRIDDELIVFGEPSRSAPYGFISCTRGAFGTKVSAHRKGAAVQQLTQIFGKLVPKMGSELFFEIARQTARAYNEGGFSMIYLDGLEGMYYLSAADTELTWYYEELFVNEVLKYTKTPPLLEYSAFSTNLWYGRSRMGAWDAPHRGYKRFINEHIASNQASADRLYLPGQMGWVELCPSRGDDADNFQYPIFFREDVEWLGAKSLAGNYGLSYVDATMNDREPFVYRNGEILKNYDSLRRVGYFKPGILQQLRDPHADFLLQKSGRDWQITAANYAHFLLRGDDAHRFSYRNPYPEQAPMIRIECRHRLAAYRSPQSIDLLPLDETKPVGSMTVREFETPVDLSNHLGLGVWVYGDGKGQRINIRLESPAYLVSGFTDHFIEVNFTGWRYFALAEADNGNYAGTAPNSLMAEFREAVHFNSISKVSLSIKGDTTHLRFRTIRALPLADFYLVNPALQTRERKITFKGRIKSGHFLEYTPGGRAVVYDAAGREISEMQPDRASFKVSKGDNSLLFSSADEPGQSAAVRITLRTNDSHPL